MLNLLPNPIRREVCLIAIRQLIKLNQQNSNFINKKFTASKKYMA